MKTITNFSLDVDVAMALDSMKGKRSHFVNEILRSALLSGNADSQKTVDLSKAIQSLDDEKKKLREEVAQLEMKKKKAEKEGASTTRVVFR
jgi:outer membrane murein-binding lipoprotein Lpp